MMLYDNLDPIAQKYPKILVQYFNDANVSIDHIASMAGPSKFSAVDQEASPSEPLTRVVKDILRVGSFDVTQPDGKVLQWDVTSDSLYLLQSTYEQFHAAGGRSNLYWGASTSGDQHDISAEKAIAEIDKIFVADSRLWVVVYVTPEVASELQNPKNRVSAAIDQNWASGQVIYPLIVTHVAIVDQPVVGGQLPFARLSNQPRGLSMTPEQIAKLVSDGVTAGMESVLATVDQRIADRVKLATPDVAALEESISLRLSNKQAADTAKAVFGAELDGLFSAQHIDAATKDQLLAAGEKAGYDPVVLAPFKALRLSNQPRKLGGASGGDSQGSSPADRANAGREAAKKWYGKK